MKATFKIIGIVILLSMLLAGFYFYLGLPDVSRLKTQNPRTTALMVQRYREAKKTDDTFRVQQQWIDFEAIPKLLRETVRISEDAAFYQHKGIDFVELKEALKKNWQNNLSKDRIFTIYLNVIEWGPGLFGVEAASQHYFHKGVGQLNLEEIVRLVAVIPQPLKITPTENSDWLKWKARWILDALRRYAYIDQAVYQAVYDRFQ
jgi:monofunctional biosynthetic peptidoglycan transglycosylase